MGVKAKVSTVVLLIVILVVGLWQLSSPPTLPSVGTKYATGPYSSLGNWIIKESFSEGEVFLAFSIANLTFPRASLSTTYSVVISKVNETITGSYVRSLSLRVTGMTVEDNYDGTTSAWGKTAGLGDAVQVTSLFLFKTSGTHQLRFGITYELYALLLVGYLPKYSATKSFNVTQIIV